MGMVLREYSTLKIENWETLILKARSKVGFSKKQIPTNLKTLVINSPPNLKTLLISSPKGRTTFQNLLLISGVLCLIQFTSVFKILFGYLS